MFQISHSSVPLPDWWAVPTLHCFNCLADECPEFVQTGRIQGNAGKLFLGGVRQAPDAVWTCLRAVASLIHSEYSFLCQFLVQRVFFL